MKKLILAASIVAAFTGNFAHAQEAAAPEHSLTYNAGITSDYRFRGISQSRLGPAVSLGADYTNTPTGLYVGTWVSTIKWIKDSGASKGSSELDIYAGKRGELAKGVTYDAGLAYFYYSQNRLNAVPGFSNANSTEAYLQLGFGPAYVKYFHCLTDFFGTEGSKNSTYYDIGADLDVAEGTRLNLHVGHQKIKNYADYDYTDWKIGVTKDFGIAAVSLAYIGTNADRGLYTPASTGKFTGRNAAVLSVTKTF